MCCGIGRIVGGFIGSIVLALEKLTSIAAMTAVIMCIVSTVTISLGLGVGLGYNYCFVSQKMVSLEETDGKDDSDARRRAAETVLPFIPTESISTIDYVTGTGALYTEAPTESTTESTTSTTPETTVYTHVRVRKDTRPLYYVDLTQPGRRLPASSFNYRLTIPLHGDFDFVSLLAELRRRNKNVTLDLIT